MAATNIPTTTSGIVSQLNCECFQWRYIAVPRKTQVAVVPSERFISSRAASSEFSGDNVTSGSELIDHLPSASNGHEFSRVDRDAMMTQLVWQERRVHVGCNPELDDGAAQDRCARVDA
jgi:hypothetical protein